MLDKEKIVSFLYFDVETVSQEKNFEILAKKNARLSKLWERRAKYYRTAYEEMKGLSDGEIYSFKAALEPEFSKVVCVSFGSFTDNNQRRFVSFSGEDEEEILNKSNKVFNNAWAKNWKLCGHNIKGFDVPCLGKRMLYSGLNPSQILQVWDKKPWEIPFIDTTEIFCFGSWSQQKYLSLDLLTQSFGIPSPKNEIDGSMVSEIFWEQKDFSKIEKYCESDVNAVMSIVEKICF